MLLALIPAVAFIGYKSQPAAAMTGAGLWEVFEARCLNPMARSLKPDMSGLTSLDEEGFASENKRFVDIDTGVDFTLKSQGNNYVCTITFRDNNTTLYTFEIKPLISEWMGNLEYNETKYCNFLRAEFFRPYGSPSRTRREKLLSVHMFNTYPPLRESIALMVAEHDRTAFQGEQACK
jgi:hypothetical protein